MEQLVERRTSVSCLVDYVRKGEEVLVISFLKQQPNIMKQKNFNTLIKAIVEEEREEVLVWLLNSGFNKNAALDIAITNGSERIINLVLDQGADKDEGLYFAVKTNKTKLIAVLLARGANINTNKRNGNTPLHVAITLKCDVSVIEFLIEHGADTNARTRNNKTAVELINNSLISKINDSTKDKLKEIENLLKLNQLSDDVFECLQGLPDGLSGYSYQIKLFTLYAIVNTKLAISSDCKYELGTEVTDLVPFDDIYSKRIQNGRSSYQFVQVKQTKKPELNKINESDFFTMLKSGENIKEYIKGNGTIFKMFIKFGDICNRRLDGDDGEFIYCTNTDFKNSRCYLFEQKTKDDLLCGVGGLKWQIVDWRYIDIEIKFVLLNLIKSWKFNNLLDDDLKKTLTEQIRILDQFNVEKVSEKYEECELWSISKIAKVGVDITDKCSNFYKIAKALITLASNVETVKENTPDECELPNYTGELTSIINSTIAKIDEVSKSLKSDKKLFVYFSENDDCILMRDKIDSFINHFSIYTACPTSDQLDDIITKEVSEEFKLHKSKLLSFYCVQFFNKWISDFKNKLGNMFKHEDGKQLFRDLRVQIFKGFGKSYAENLLSYNVHFKDNNKSVVDFFNKNKNNKILHIVTNYPHLHTLKVLQTLKNIENIIDFNSDNILFTSSEVLVNSGDAVKDFFEEFSSTNSGGDLLVIVLSNYFNDDSNICNHLKKLKNITDSIKKKIILIGNKHNKIATTLEDMFEEYLSCTDTIAFKDLTEETQAYILEKTVNFKNDPNSPETLKKIKDFLTAPVACEVIDEEMLSMIIKNAEILQIGDDKPFYSDLYIKEYYIPRRIHPQMIDKCVLRYIHNHLTFITGISKTELMAKIYGREELIIFMMQMNGEEELIHVWREDKCFNNGIIVISEEENNITNKEIFSHISNASGKNINWLEFRDELLFLKGIKIDSKDGPRTSLEVSDMDEIQLEKYSVNPESLDQKIVILANNPGEGKSTMLTDLSYAIKEKHPDLWIVRVDLKDFVDVQTPTSLNSISFVYEETAKAVKTITRMVVCDDSNIKARFERILLEASLNACANIKVVLFIDGFDEISPDYKEKSCILLKALKNSNVQQLWITTRVHLKEFLEEELMEPVHVLSPLTKMEQIEFLNKYWKWNLKNYKSSEYETEEQICAHIVNSLKACYDIYCLQTSRPHDLDSLLDIIEEVSDYSLKSLQQTIDEKLDMSLCAEVSLKKWERTLRYEHAFSKVPLNLKMLSENLYKSNWQIENLKNTGTFEIYKQFIEFKMKIYRENKSTTQSGNPADRELADLASTLIRKLHREVAVKTLFPHARFLPELNITEEYNNSNQIITRMGLVKSCEDGVNFVHRSYAEYFFSEYLWIHLNNPSVQSELLADVLLNVQYQLVRTFLDGFLSQTESKPCSPKVLKEIMMMQNVHKESIMHVVSIERYKHIRTYVLNSFERHNKAVDILLKFEKEAPKFAEVELWANNEEVCDIITEKIKQYPDVLRYNKGRIVFNSAAILKNKEVRDIIRIAAMEHHYALKDMLLKRTYRGTTSLHEAVINKRVDVCKHIMTSVYNHFDDFQSIIFSCDWEMRSAMTSAVTLDVRDKYDYGITQSSKKEIC